MGCCGSTQKVRKIVIPPQHKPVQPAKVQIRQDDIIQVPKNKRKLFRIDFDLKTVLLPEYLIVKSWDYSPECTEVEILGQLMRQELKGKDSTLKGEEMSMIQQNKKNNKFEQSTQANYRIAQREVNVQVLDDLNKKPQKRQQLVLN